VAWVGVVSWHCSQLVCMTWVIMWSLLVISVEGGGGKDEIDKPGSGEGVMISMGDG